MSFKNLKEIIEAEQIPSYLLVIAEDEIRKKRALEFINNSLVKKLNVSNIDFKSIHNFKKNDLLHELQSPGLFSPHNVRELKLGKELKANELQELKECLERVPPGVTLVISATQLRKNSGIYKKAKKDGALVEFEKLEGKKLWEWIKKECQRQELTSFPKTLPGILSELYESELDAIAKSISFISTYAENGSVDEKELKNLFPATLTASEFDLLDVLSSKNQGKAEQLLQELLFVGKNPFFILSLLQRNYNQLYLIRQLLARRVDAASIQKKLNIPAWLYRKLAQKAAGIKTGNIERARAHLIWADSRLKDKSLGPDTILSELCSRLCRLHS